MLQADTRKLYPTERFGAGIEELQRFIAERRAFLLQRVGELGG